MRTTKFAALVAAVALLVVGAAFASFAATGWVLEGDDWYYYDKEDVMADSCWRESNGGWYWLNESGVMEKEAFVEWKNNLYYVNESGLMVTGWQKIYDEDDDADYWYFFQDNGAAYKNTKKEVPTSDGSHTYIFDENARMLTGWVATTSDDAAKYASVENTEYGSDNTLYYCGDENDGAVVLADWRYLNVAAEDEEDDFYWFYFQASGKKAFGKPLNINSKRYAFDEEGKMISDWSVTPSSDPDATASYYDADGAQVTSGWFQAYDKMADDVDEDEDELFWYYALSKTEIAKNRFIVDGGKLYLLDEEGKLVSGFAYVLYDEVAGRGNKNVKAIGYSKNYLTEEDGDWKGSELKDETIDLYFFNTEHDGTFGAMQTGTIKASVDGDETEFKLTTGSKIAKGAGVVVKGFDGSYYYTNGQLLTGDDDYKYVAMECTFDDDDASKYGVKKLENVELSDVDTQVKAKTLNGYDVETASKKYVVITSKGSFVKSLSKKDEDDFKWVVKDYILQSVTEIK